ncbi:MAG: LLM class F420-dependent oxidoreductase [Chloroflexi bacterium]|nr:LLM class F420-dependent oxidoreductase [Chloroflexota bacterium]
MTQIGIMIEGQHDLNWARWKRLLQAAEDFGYQCVFRSDHFTNANPPDYDSLELWVSLTYAASHTKRIEFGPLVTPVTFRHPATTVRMAAQVDDLSEGRLVLGMGAGWQEREHRLFGIPFYDVPTRFGMLTDALEMTRQLLYSDTPVTFKGQYFSLDEAILLPRPQRKGGPPILIGGRGPKRTLPLAAKYADEWNGVFIPLEQFKERNALLNQLLDEGGRSRQEVKRSLMTQVIYEPTEAELDARLAGKPNATELIANNGLIVGTGSAVVDQIGAWVEAGVERFMLQWVDYDNIDDLEKMARDVLPHFHKN